MITFFVFFNFAFADNYTPPAKVENSKNADFRSGYWPKNQVSHYDFTAMRNFSPKKGNVIAFDIIEGCNILTDFRLIAKPKRNYLYLNMKSLEGKEIVNLRNIKVFFDEKEQKMNFESIANIVELHGEITASASIPLMDKEYFKDVKKIRIELFDESNCSLSANFENNGSDYIYTHESAYGGMIFALGAVGNPSGGVSDFYEYGSAFNLIINSYNPDYPNFTFEMSFFSTVTDIKNAKHENFANINSGKDREIRISRSYFGFGWNSYKIYRNHEFALTGTLGLLLHGSGFYENGDKDKYTPVSNSSLGAKFEFSYDYRIGEHNQLLDSIFTYVGFSVGKLWMNDIKLRGDNVGGTLDYVMFRWKIK